MIVLSTDLLAVVGAFLRATTVPAGIAESAY